MTTPHCSICGSDGHPTGHCCHCGSSKHPSEDCSILQKVRLVLAGVPPEHLFDNVYDLTEVKP